MRDWARLPSGIPGRTREEDRARQVVRLALEGVEGLAGFRFLPDGTVRVFADGGEGEDGPPLCQYETGRRGFSDEVEELRALVTVALVMLS